MLRPPMAPSTRSSNDRFEELMQQLAQFQTTFSNKMDEVSHRVAVLESRSPSSSYTPLLPLRQTRSTSSSWMFHVLRELIPMVGFLKSLSFLITMRRRRKNALLWLPFTWTEPPYRGTSGCTEMVKSFLGHSSSRLWKLVLLQPLMIICEVSSSN